SAGAIQKLDPEIHGIDDKQVSFPNQNLGGQTELSFAAALFADRLQDAAVHIEHENFVAQRVGDVDAFGRRINGNPRRALEQSLATLQATDRPAKLSIAVKD